MTLAAKSVHVEPGGQATLAVEVHNRGRTVDQLTLEVAAPVAAWCTVDPAQCNLMPDTAAVAMLIFRPPRSSAVPAGPTPVDVALRSHEHPDAWAVDRVIVDIAPFVELEAGLTPRVLQGVAGARTTMRATNRGNAPVDLSLTAEDAEAALEFRITPATLRVNAGMTADVAVGIRPRVAIAPGPDRARPFQVLVTLGDGSRRALDGTFTQSPAPAVVGPPLLATLSRDAARVEPGRQVVVGVEMVNQGSVVDQLSLELHGPAAAWATVEPTHLNVLPGAASSAAVTLQPPRVPGMVPGPYQADVIVRSREHPEAAVMDRVVVEVLPFADIDTRLIPSVLNHRREATTTVGVLNRGNTRIEVALRGDDPATAFEFRVSPPTLRLDPGQAGSARVTVRARQGPTPGMEQARPFRILVAGRDGSSQALDGTFVQAARARRRLGCLPCLFRWLLLLLALAAAAWLALGAIDFWHVGFDNVFRALNLPAQPPGSTEPTEQPPDESGIPDLVISRLEVFPESPAAGSDVTVKVWVQNIGSAPSGTYSFDIEITPYGNQGGYAPGGPIQPGQEVYAAWPTFTIADPGPHEVVVIISPFDFQDGDPGNNTASRTIEAH